MLIKKWAIRLCFVCFSINGWADPLEESINELRKLHGQYDDAVRSSLPVDEGWMGLPHLYKWLDEKTEHGTKSTSVFLIGCGEKQVIQQPTSSGSKTFVSYPKVMQIARIFHDGTLSIVDEDEQKRKEINRGRFFTTDAPKALYNIQPSLFRKAVPEELAKKLWLNETELCNLSLLKADSRYAFNCSIDELLTSPNNHVKKHLPKLIKKPAFDYVISCATLRAYIMEMHRKFLEKKLEPNMRECAFISLLEAKEMYLINLLSLVKTGGCLVLDVLTYNFWRAGFSFLIPKNAKFTDYLNRKSHQLKGPIVKCKPIETGIAVTGVDGSVGMINAYGQVYEVDPFIIINK